MKYCDLHTPDSLQDEEGDFCPLCNCMREKADSITRVGTQLAQAKDRIMNLEEALKEEVDNNYAAQARIKELEAECAIDKTEITCLSCKNKFSILDDDEVNWTCPVCSLHNRIKEFEGLVREMGDVLLQVCSANPCFHGGVIISRDRARKILNRPEVKAIFGDNHE